MPTLTQLQYIVAVRRTGHFGRAAASCEVSQPTLSAQVAKAEAELGVPLFDRRSTPVSVTEPGRQLVELASAVLVAHGRLVAAAQGSSALRGPFSLGIIPTLAPTVLPWFLASFPDECPEVELTVVERTTEEILRSLREQELDAGLVATPLGEAGLERQVLFYDPFYVYAQAGSPLLDHGELSVADIERDDLWLLEDGHCFRNQVVHLCGLQRREVLQSVRFEAGSFDTLCGLIDRVGGCTLLPETYARTLPTAVRLAQVRAFAEVVPTREVSLVSQRRHWKTEVLHRLAESLRTHAPRSLPRQPEDRLVLPVEPAVP